MTAVHPTERGQRVSIVQLRALIEEVERQGVRGEDFMQGARFDSDLLERSDAWLESTEFDRLIELALDRTGNPAFGLHWGEQATLMKYDLVTPLVATAKTLRAAVLAVVKFQRLLQDHVDIAFEERGGAGAITCSPMLPHRPARRVHSELFVVGMSRVLQYYGGSDGIRRRVAFDYAEPEYSAEYSRILGPAVEFDRRVTTLEFDAAVLDIPQVQWNPRIYEAVELEAERALAQLGRSKHYTERLRRHLHEAFPALPGMDQAAKELGMAQRSLRRRLAAEGSTFQELVVEARVGGALRLLRNPECSVKQAAYQMGFTSPSAFHRAFKRWTGMSPSEARQTDPPRSRDNAG